MPTRYAICNVSVLPLRKEPMHRAEQVSQLLFGEKAEILEENNNEWSRIRCAWDGYEGWCKTSQLQQIPARDFRRDTAYLVADNNGKLVFEEDTLWLPAGASLKRGSITVNANSGRYKGKKLSVSDLSTTGERIREAAMLYINAPYQWGGRSVAGIDCSGLSQMAFLFCNKQIPRDAWQQAEEGTTVDFLQNARCGDLAFFDNAEGRINHVGVLLDNATILHATDGAGRVVIDKIDQGGIISRLMRKRTHNLRLVKRYF